MCRFVRRVTGSTALGLVGGLLLALDGLHLVLSRLALLDIFLAFFILCGVHCVVADRQWFRERLATGATRRLLRPWLLAGGVAFGLAVGTKWTALFPLAAFGLLACRVELGRTAVLRPPAARCCAPWPSTGCRPSSTWCGIALVVYVATWSGWLVHAAEYEEALSNTQYTTYDGGTQWPTATEADAEGAGEVVQSLRSLWYYHQDVYTFHAHFLNDSEHVYASKPAGWLLMSRPVGVDAQLDIQPGSQGCDAPAGSTCLRQVLLLGNPLIWWGGALALLFAVVRWVGARDWRFGVAVVGTGSTWLPWLMYDDRPIFIFYAVACLPFVVLALTLALGSIVGRSDVPSPRRTAGVVVAGSYVVLVAARLRVVLADLDRPADHQRGVARPGVVHPLDLARRSRAPLWARRVGRSAGSAGSLATGGVRHGDPPARPRWRRTTRRRSIPRRTPPVTRQRVGSHPHWRRTTRRPARRTRRTPPAAREGPEPGPGK